MELTPSYLRYQRQTTLKEFGVARQHKLSEAKVLVIGAGGLGCPALQYLAAAGVGHIGIVDGDNVELTNLHRQILYNESDIGKNKAHCAAEKIRAMNSTIKVEVFGFRINNKNILQIVPNFDIVLDGTDNFATRYLINDSCVVHNKPLVYGAVLRFEGQVGVFNLIDSQSEIKTNYRDLFPEPPESEAVVSCTEAGVIGVLPGIIGTMQATETIKIISGVGQVLTNKIITYNALHNTFYDTEIIPSVKKQNFLTSDEIQNFDYEFFCSSHYQVSELSVAEFETIRTRKTTLVIDIREKEEEPKVSQFEYVTFTPEQLYTSLPEDMLQKEIVLFCAIGARSKACVRNLKHLHPELTIHSLAGGIRAWNKYYKLVDES